MEEKAKELIEIFKQIAEKAGFSAGAIVKKDFNYQFQISEAGARVIVQLYFGKKGLKLVFQGDLKSDLFSKIKNIIHEQQELNLIEKQNDEPSEYIGTDEAGKGDLFGPLVVAAAFVDNNSKRKLRNIGVRDSKDIGDTEISILAKEIKKINNNKFNIISIEPHEYNLFYEKFKNLNKLLNWAHSKAIENLFDSVKCNYVITDKFSGKELQIAGNKNFSHIEFLQYERAERFVGVAAASILARDSFNQWFVKQSKRGLSFPKGSSEKSKFFAQNFIDKFGIEKLEMFGKIHFKTFRQLHKE